MGGIVVVEVLLVELVLDDVELVEVVEEVEDVEEVELVEDVEDVELVELVDEVELVEDVDDVELVELVELVEEVELVLLVEVVEVEVVVECGTVVEMAVVAVPRDFAGGVYVIVASGLNTCSMLTKRGCIDPSFVGPSQYTSPVDVVGQSLFEYRSGRPRISNSCCWNTALDKLAASVPSLTAATSRSVSSAVNNARWAGVYWAALAALKRGE
eukprot:gene2445-biopygen1970